MKSISERGFDVYTYDKTGYINSRLSIQNAQQQQDQV